MKSASEVLASMKPDESLIDKYLNDVEKLIDEAAKEGKYSVPVTINFLERSNIDVAFLKKEIPQRLTEAGYTLSSMYDTVIGMNLTIRWKSNSDQKSDIPDKGYSYKVNVKNPSKSEFFVEPYWLNLW